MTFNKNLIEEFEDIPSVTINKENADEFVNIIGQPLVDAIKRENGQEKHYFEVVDINKETKTIVLNRIKKLKVEEANE